jgi:hypothetical protein
MKKKPKTKKPARVHLREATGETLRRAWSEVARRITKDDSTVAASDAGFVIPPGQKVGEREGFQVFVEMRRFSEKLLREEPISGGLLKWRSDDGGPGAPVNTDVPAQGITGPGEPATGLEGESDYDLLMKATLELQEDNRALECRMDAIDQLLRVVIDRVAKISGTSKTTAPESYLRPATAADVERVLRSMGVIQ